jgi:glucose-1-phosphate thymidylyltransferase
MSKIKIIGILPAAGLGSRLHPLPYPKELLPVFFATDDNGESLQPRVAAEYSLQAMRKAGIEQCVIVISERKMEIIRYFGDGRDAKMSLAYISQTTPLGLAHAIDLAYDWLADSYTCLALPDTIFEPSNAISIICQEIIAKNADIVLGVFPTDKPERLGPVRFATDGTVTEVQDKPPQTDLRNTWGVVVWSPRFAQFLHEKINLEKNNLLPESIIIGHVFHQAILAGLKVNAVFFSEGKYTDLGTPEGISSFIFQGSR